MSTKSPPPFFDSKIAYTSPQPSTDDIAPTIGHFSDLDRLPTELLGHLKQCDSPLSELNGEGLIAYLEDAKKQRVAFMKKDHIWVSVLSESVQSK